MGYGKNSHPPVIFPMKSSHAAPQLAPAIGQSGFGLHPVSVKFRGRSVDPNPLGEPLLMPDAV